MFQIRRKRHERIAQSKQSCCVLQWARTSTAGYGRASHELRRSPPKARRVSRRIEKSASAFTSRTRGFKRGQAGCIGWLPTADAEGGPQRRRPAIVLICGKPVDRLHELAAFGCNEHSKLRVVLPARSNRGTYWIDKNALKINKFEHFPANAAGASGTCSLERDAEKWEPVFR